MPWTTKMQQFIIQHDSDWNSVLSSDSSVHIILFECAHRVQSEKTYIYKYIYYNRNWKSSVRLSFVLRFGIRSVARVPCSKCILRFVVCFVRSFVTFRHVHTYAARSHSEHCHGLLLVPAAFVWVSLHVRFGLVACCYIEKENTENTTKYMYICI